MRVAPALLLSLMLGTASAFAEPVQSSDDIVKFYAEAARQGATRAVCIGTEQECASKKVEPVKTGLDMMVNFDLGSAEIRPDARNQLDEFAKALRDNRLRKATFVVEGYTDASGSETYNLSLSERRARSVAAYLLAAGIEPERLQAEGKGEGSPRADNPYDPLNRRVEMRMRLQ